VPVPKWMRGTRPATAASARRDQGATNDRRSRPGDSEPAQESNSCTAEAPASTCTVRKAPEMSAHQAQQLRPGVRVGVHHGAGGEVVAAGAALDEVGGQRERGAGEADQRRPGRVAGRRGGEFGDDEGDGGGDGARVAGLVRGEASHVGGGADRLVDDRPDAGGDLDVDPGQGQREP
jgi:hypothetical protein